MKICIRNVLLLVTFLSTEQLYCMNKENSIKIEQQETIKKILADKETRDFLRNKILAQERKIEEEIDKQLLPIMIIGAAGTGFVMFASLLIGNIILDFFNKQRNE